MTSKPVLEPAAQQFADATANPPYLFDLGPEKGREAVDQVQSGDIAKPDVDVATRPCPAGRPARCRSASCARAAPPARCR